MDHARKRRLLLRRPLWLSIESPSKRGMSENARGITYQFTMIPFIHYVLFIGKWKCSKSFNAMHVYNVPHVYGTLEFAFHKQAHVSNDIKY
ncbi:hypothetical protein EUGRSUZ_E03568 [Eucalyptus grandis]|uniref:Uncharacterized protein n=2 Tax=Eucalyptus grandis TaxID=71139 RepID=A0ACC3KZL8_EUCGR|nr:hypothetical protein EUGRSUZ_E03568 [Eucalyptus grandis]